MTDLVSGATMGSGSGNVAGVRRAPPLRGRWHVPCPSVSGAKERKPSPRSSDYGNLGGFAKKRKALFKRALRGRANRGLRAVLSGDGGQFWGASVSFGFKGVSKVRRSLNSARFPLFH